MSASTFRNNMSMEKKISIAVFYDWLAKIEPVVNSQGLCKEAGIYPTALNKHHRAIRHNGKKGDEKIWPLSPQNFYAIAKAFLKNTSSSLHLGGIEFKYVAESDGIAIISPWPFAATLSESEFNAMFG